MHAPSCQQKLHNNIQSNDKCLTAQFSLQHTTRHLLIYIIVLRVFFDLRDVQCDLNNKKVTFIKCLCEPLFLGRYFCVFWIYKKKIVFFKNGYGCGYYDSTAIGWCDYVHNEYGYTNGDPRDSSNWGSREFSTTTASQW